MLRVSVHSGTPDKRSIHNELMSVDIAYESQKAMANYWVSLQGRSNDARVAALTSYPRWSASLWDLAARAIASALYGTEPVPPAAKPDCRCAYATQVCVVIENVELDHREQCWRSPRLRKRLVNVAGTGSRSFSSNQNATSLRVQ